jgi:alpha-ketoglutarate-dependent taurine dioxygenase
MNPRETPMPTLRRVARVAQKLDPPEVMGAVRLEPLSPGRDLPWVIQPTVPGTDLVRWAGESRDWIEALLSKHGGLLFRGFPVGDLADLQRFIAAVSSDLLEYRYRSTPRTEVAGKIYTSTEYPADQEIPMHNENSYSNHWPLKIFFFCERPAATGGMTPIADSARVFERISPAVRDRFSEKKVMYVRNYGGGADLPWQEVFQTQDPGEVEAFCREHGIEVEWLGEGRLRTRQICQAVVRHPKSGRMLWFNQAHLFHMSSLDPEIRETLLELFGADELPRNAFYGDGSPLEKEALDEIRQAYRDEQVAFPWERGDVLLLDNMAVSHGRTPYSGERKIRVGMTELIDGGELAG